MSAIDVFQTDGDYISHPNLEPEIIQNRQYQRTLATNCLVQSSLVSLPTGLGKTTVSLLITAARLDKYPNGKVLFLAPNKPLVQQHTDFYKKALSIPADDIKMFTGDVRPAKREQLWDETQIVIATPQVIENDLIGGRITLDNVVHITFDECHRASGDYAYVYIADRYNADANNPLVTGMSASPGGNVSEITNVCNNLGIRNVEVMTEEDSDISEYSYDVDIDWHRVELPDELLDIRNKLESIIEDRLTKMRRLGVTNRESASNLSMGALNGMRQELIQGMDNDDSAAYKAMSLHAEIVKLKHAITILESQGVQPLRSYFERRENAAQSSGASKASKRLASDTRFKEAKEITFNSDAKHPKLEKARELITQTIFYGGERVILFTEYRDTAEELTTFLSDRFDVHKFVGQADKDGSKGMSQKQQKDVLERFRNNEFQVLVSTSVAEEGLDVPEVDLVLFYEPVPKGVRAVQRKGRTGRQKEGNVSVLMAEDTSDIGKYWKSIREQDTMENELDKLKEIDGDIQDELGGEKATTLDEYVNTDSDNTNNSTEQTDEEADESVVEPDIETVETTEEEPNQETKVTVEETDDDTVEIVIDNRELDSTVARTLSKKNNITTRLENLEVGDYVLSDRVVVERKSVSDFVDTLVNPDRSFFEQAGDMASQYDRPIIIIEGSGIYAQRNVHPNAIRGAISSAAVDFNISIINTEDENDTAEMIETIATREQTERDREVSVHGNKTEKTMNEQQEYVVSSIAEVGPVTAQSLLEHFGSVKRVMNATSDEMKQVSGIGQVTADRIVEVINTEYNTE